MQPTTPIAPVRAASDAHDPDPGRGNEARIDTVDHPPHYTATAVEPIVAIEAWDLGFCLGNTVKYIARAGRKDATKLIEDLKKARWYLDREIARLEGGSQ